MRQSGSGCFFSFFPVRVFLAFCLLSSPWLLSHGIAQTFSVTLEWEVVEKDKAPDGFKVVWGTSPHADVTRSTGGVMSADPYNWSELVVGADKRSVTIGGIGLGLRCFRVSSYVLNPEQESLYSNEVCTTLEENLVLELHMPVGLIIKSIKKEG